MFRNLCASCHRLDQKGYNVGPDLADMRRQAKETILYHIVVPEAEIAPPFVMYVAETKDGRTLSGILTSETAASITLQGPLAYEETVRRHDLARLEALPVSPMPSGLEAAMSQQDLADLLAYLRGEQ
ncbi:MAG: c-type cytochrome [Luteitalea sp.]|nr:c-type cytochrome [Luteitalea sp.]